MPVVHATWKNGQIVPDEPVNWPDGARLVVDALSVNEISLVREDDWPTDAQSIAQHLVLMDQIEPFDMTPAEEAAWEAARRAQKLYEKDRFSEHANELQRIWG